MKHGKTYTPEWNCWRGILERCRRPRCAIYRYYGGRGISVCSRWADFQNFLSDMGEKPSPSHTIDRIDSNGNYEPSNCRWATRKEQANNSSKCHYIEFRGKRLSISGWADEIGIAATTIQARLVRLRWPIERALTSGLYER